MVKIRISSGCGDIGWHESWFGSDTISISLPFCKDELIRLYGNTWDNIPSDQF